MAESRSGNDLGRGGARKSVLSPVNAAAADSSPPSTARARHMEESSPPRRPAPGSRYSQRKPPRMKQPKHAFRIPADLLELLRDASFELRVPMNTICVDALRAELSRIQDQLGGEIPPRGEQEVRIGRPIG